ncbi:MAG: glycosyltransferase family 9 protein [Candidatus Methanomethyliaceae archaeon]
MQLGAETSQRLQHVDIDLVGKTNLNDVVSILSESKLHLDNESGLVHIATSLGVKCCVCFGPTPVDFFGYEENINLAPAQCGGCWWSTRDWMEQCPRGFEKPICMESISPRLVTEKAYDFLEKIISKTSILECTK